MMSYNTQKQIKHGLMLAVLAMLAFLVILPLVLILTSSFKNEQELFDYPFHLLPRKPILSNFSRLKEHFPTYIWNSIRLTILITVVQLVTASTGAYAFAKLQWKGRDAVFALYLASMMVPTQAITIPQFLIIRSMGLYDTHLALVLIGAFTAIGTFLIRQAFLSIPPTFSEAARIDGASEWSIFLKIILPMAKATLMTQMIFSFRFFWNDFFNPLIYITSSELKTLPLGMTDFVSDQYTYWGPQLAATLISIIPVLAIFLVGQKSFVQGVASSGIKG